MYGLLRDLVLTLLRCPKEPPEAPAGSYDSVHLFRASHSYLRYRMLKVMIGLIVSAIFETIGVVFLLTTGKLMLTLLGFALLGLMAFKFFWALLLTRMEYDMRYYMITDRSLRIREGIWYIREVTLTFANIQNMKIEQGPLMRAFGIYDLVVDTAGGGGSLQQGQQGPDGNVGPVFHRGVFRGLGRPEELRDQILRYLRQIPGTGLGDSDEADAADYDTTTGGFNPDEIEALRALRDECSAWRKQLAA